MPHSFVHLRVHSEYSVAEGAARLSAGGVIARAAELQMPALGLADLGNIFGAVKFFESCRQHGIKPIIGCDMPIGDKHHMLLLCADNEGYRNLNRLLTRAYIENGGMIHPQWLQNDNRGLILLSGGMRGEIGHALRIGDEKRAVEVAAQWRECFGDRFYVEVWRAEDDDGQASAASVVAAKVGASLAATHPVQCARAGDLEMLEMRRCIAHNWLLGDNSRARPFASPPHLLSAEEMQQRFADMPMALDNSIIIAQRCNFAYTLGANHLPKITPPAGMTAAELLIKLSHEGMEKRGIVLDKAEEYARRLQTELEIINRMNYADYYLIVADFVGWAKAQGIPVGPGRGSGSASLVAYALAITELDPIVYGLLFERFLNPERVSLPDFDIDFCVDGRDRVIDYVGTKYGSDRVSQIVTFGQIAARSAVRDVGRVLGLPYSLCDRVARLMPGTPDMTIDKALTESPQLKEEAADNEEVQNLLDKARKVEKLPRNIGTHAGGVLIAPEPITNFCPLYAAADTKTMVSQMDLKDVEKIGLVKFDFLGLTTLTILAHAEHLLKKIGAVDEDFSLADLSLEDDEVYKVYASGELKGVFQCESAGMRGMMRRVKPDRFADIVALIALYRPGPMQFMETFINRKHGREEIVYPHPILRESLAETYGVWVYQEQVMETARKIADYSLGEADLLRRAMGKKQPMEMQRQRQRFVDGAKSRMSAEAADKVFSQIADFAEYGFNKAHAAAYALVSYRTAYLKAYHPAALYAAAMSVSGSDKDIKELADCAKAAKVRLLPPDINRGRRDFDLSMAGEIIYGLKAVKTVGGALVDDIVEVRGDVPFVNLFDFCRRMNGRRQMNKTAVANLVFAGAFDGLHKNRAAVCETLPSAMEDNASGGAGLFGEEVNALADVSAWGQCEILLNEQKALGFPLSDSFYALHKDFLRDAGLRPKTLFEMQEQGDDSFRIAGILSAIISPRALRQHGLKVLVLEDESLTNFEISVDAGVLAAADKPKEGRDLVIVEGRNGRARRLRAAALWTIDAFILRRAAKLTVRCSAQTSPDEICQMLSPARNLRGNCEVVLEYEDADIRCAVSLGKKWQPGEHLCTRLREYGGVALSIEYRNSDV